MIPTSSPALDRRLLRNPQIEEAPLQGELMLFDPATSKFFVLNKTMAYIWRRCDGQESLEGILEGLRAEFSAADRATVETDLARAVEQLSALSLVVDSREPSA